MAGIEFGYSGHSTRGASTSAAAAGGLSVDLILKAADWAFAQTFECFLWVQSWHGGESTCLQPMSPGFDSQTWHHMWVEFVGSLLRSQRFLSGYWGFPSPQKPTFDLICINLMISVTLSPVNAPVIIGCLCKGGKQCYRFLPS